MKNYQLDKPLKFFTTQLRKRLGKHLKQIILFGSRARGDYDPDSDYDCLIVVDDVTEEIVEVIDDIAGVTLYRYNLVFSAFPVTMEKYQNENFYPLYINIKKEGIPL